MNITTYILLYTLAHLHFNRVRIPVTETVPRHAYDSSQTSTEKKRIDVMNWTPSSAEYWIWSDPNSWRFISGGTKGPRRGVIHAITTRWRQIATPKPVTILFIRIFFSTYLSTLNQDQRRQQGSNRWYSLLQCGQLILHLATKPWCAVKSKIRTAHV